MLLLMVLLYDEGACSYCPINYTTLNHGQLRGGCNIIQEIEEKNVDGSAHMITL